MKKRMSLSSKKSRISLDTQNESKNASIEKNEYGLKRGSIEK